jgi:selenide,water dikinase
MKSIPGGTYRNWDSYGDKISFIGDINKEYATALLADPQTSGGLLIAVEENAANEVQDLLQSAGLYASPIGKTKEKNAELIRVC